MATLNKWNYSKHEYEEIEIPDEWIVKSYSPYMDEKINCAECGKEMTFGQGYTSMEIHTIPLGFGYAVCESCYEEEWERRKETENDEKMFNDAEESEPESKNTINTKIASDIKTENERLREENRLLGNKIDAVTEYLESYMPNYSFDHYDLAKAIKMLKGEE